MSNQAKIINSDPGIEMRGDVTEASAAILTPEALTFLASLHREFNPRRQELLAKRAERQAAFDAGAKPNFLAETASIRESDWCVAETPADLQQRWVEITGPVDRKMMINALNSGANAFMADLEDACSPTWTNVVEGQVNLYDAVRHQLAFENPDGRRYELNDTIATLLVRPRGWHLPEKHVLIDGEPIAASLFDAGLYLFHNAQERLDRGTGPYLYLPKLESHHEAKLWNDVFTFSEEALSLPYGCIRATVLIETVTAAFEMEEILHALRDHISGLNAGRWDYIFSMIKRFRDHSDMVLPDRSQIAMTVPFMRAYTELLVRSCHKRGAHAIGGMAALIPNRRDPELNATALAKVRDDKTRESGDGFDGTWVAHPDLIPIAREVFEQRLDGQPHQKDRLREDVRVAAADLLRTKIEGSAITEEGVRTNIGVTLQYLNAWLGGIGAAAINNLMEDAATAEISRAQLWQWLHRRATLNDGRALTRDLYQQIRVDELGKLGGVEESRFGEAAEILDTLVLDDEFVEFLTLPAYERLA